MAVAVRQRRGQASVKEMLRRRSGEVRLYEELLQGLQTRQGEGWSELSTVTA
jgi:hypothetical protein